jgi:hypothetical protein
MDESSLHARQTTSIICAPDGGRKERIGRVKNGFAVKMAGASKKNGVPRKLRKGQPPFWVFEDWGAETIAYKRVSQNDHARY